MICYLSLFFFFFFNDTATTEIYTLSLHDALPIWPEPSVRKGIVNGHLILKRDDSQVTPAQLWNRRPEAKPIVLLGLRAQRLLDRKSTRLNSSHLVISYAVFCLKKKKNMLILLMKI